MNKRWWLILPIVICSICTYKVVSNVNVALNKLSEILNSNTILNYAKTIIVVTFLVECLLILLNHESLKDKYWRVFDYFTYYAMTYTFFNIIVGLINQVTVGTQFFVNGANQFDLTVISIFSICGFLKPIPCLYNIWKQMFEYLMAKDVQVENLE